MKNGFTVGLMMTLAVRVLLLGQETLPPLRDGKAPQSYAALWAGFDSRREPLDLETLKEWEEDGVVLRIVRYRIGVFKGQRAMMAAVYGFPKGGSLLPGLVQIHGGGQYADYRAVLTNAKRGYATISIAWAGRISVPGYTVNPQGVQLFWDGATNEPAYKVTTDWGALDAYHAPCRNPRNAFAHTSAAPWTLDGVDSPRNNPWFLVTLGARRALTFLERQPEVNGARLGVYGHSMGGKLTVLTTAADGRVKAAAPSCGGVSNRSTGNALFDATIGDDVSLKQIRCPIIFLSPANDFHGRIDDLQSAVQEIRSQEWRVTCSPHHNHQDTAEYEVATQSWFDQHLKGTFNFPATPKSVLELKSTNGIPVFTVMPDVSRQILSVDIYYTQQGQKVGEKDIFENTVNRFWHHAAATKNGRTWTAELPLFRTDKPLWAYANVVHPLDQSVTGAGYYYGLYSTERFNLSSRMAMATAADLKAANVRATLKPSLLIETFEGDWQKEWFTYQPGKWARRTHKVYDAQWLAPPGAKLALEVRSEQPNKLVIGIDAHAVEAQLDGESQWQYIVLSPGDFRNAAGKATLTWAGIKELRLGGQETLRDNEVTLVIGAEWQGPKPEFRNLRWSVE